MTARVSAHLRMQRRPRVQCCQEAAGTPASWPFELRLADNATYVLASAYVLAGGTTVALPWSPLAMGHSSGIGGAAFTGVRYSWQGFPLCVLANGRISRACRSSWA